MMERARRVPARRGFSIALLLFLFGASLVVPALAFTAVGRKVLGRLTAGAPEGEATLEYRRDGVAWSLVAPWDRIVAATGLAAAVQRGAKAAWTLWDQRAGRLQDT